MRNTLVGLLGLALTAALSLPALAAGDAAAGKTAFDATCALCHSVKKGETKIGPSLAGVYGEKAAAVPGYEFSESLKKLNVTWDDATLDKWLTNPRDMAPSTKMIFPGVPDEKQRQDIIAYVKTLK
jgi:cytochrome c